MIDPFAWNICRASGLRCHEKHCLIRRNVQVIKRDDRMLRVALGVAPFDFETPPAKVDGLYFRGVVELYPLRQRMETTDARRNHHLRKTDLLPWWDAFIIWPPGAADVCLSAPIRPHFQR